MPGPADAPLGSDFRQFRFAPDKRHLLKLRPSGGRWWGRRRNGHGTHQFARANRLIQRGGFWQRVGPEILLQRLHALLVDAQRGAAIPCGGVRCHQRTVGDFLERVQF